MPHTPRTTDPATAAGGTRPRRHRARGPLRRRLIAAATGAAVALTLGLYASSTGQAAPAPAAAKDTKAAKVTEAAADDGPVGPEQTSFAAATAYALAHPTAVPSGANDWNCRPSAAHPNPVVLVHGTFENRYMNWAALSPRLKAEGYCVYALNYGGKQGDFLQATGDIAQSAGQLAAFVDRVRAQTGAAKVDLVGHSQGGMMPRHYLKNLGGTAKVGKLVALTPSNHGTSLSGLATMAKAIPGAEQVVGAACPACRQQMTGSDFITALNAGPETDPSVDYTVLATATDWVVTPYTSSYLAKAPNVSQSKLQDHCPLNLTEHLGVSYDKTAIRIVLNALDPANAERVRC